MVCIPELMAFKMSKGNVAHRYIKKNPSLPFWKCFLYTQMAAVPTADFLSLSFSLQKQQAAAMQIQVDAYYIC